MKAFNQLITVYGGQYGSEGKGQICRFLTQQLLELHDSFLGNSLSNEPILAYRIGGPNAGHTFYLPNNQGKQTKIVTCQIPGPMFVSTRVIGVIGPEGVIDPEKLVHELEMLKDWFELRTDAQRVRLMIDNSAVIINDEHKLAEGGLVGSIGSTGKGVGQATAAKVLRGANITIAKGAKFLPYLTELYKDWLDLQVVDTIAWLRESVEARGKPFLAGIIEGTQGAQLSLHTSGFWPYATSRECTPQGIWAGTGLHPEMAWRSTSIMVVRTYPIRVAGNSGPMNNETSWNEVSSKAGRDVIEQTTVTKKIRRVAELDISELQRTVFYTRPDVIALTFLDYKHPSIYCKDPNTSADALYEVQSLKKLLGVPITIVGTGEGHVYDVKLP